MVGGVGFCANTCTTLLVQNKRFHTRRGKGKKQLQKERLFLNGSKQEASLKVVGFV